MHPAGPGTITDIIINQSVPGCQSMAIGSVLTRKRGNHQCDTQILLKTLQRLKP